MKIKRELPQFEKNSAAIIVAGNLNADFYLANKGEINKVASFIVEKSKFSDREQTGKYGNVFFQSGDKTAAMKKFLQKEAFTALKTKLNTVSGAKNVYLFAPGTIMPELQKLLPKKWEKTLKMFNGNFGKLHPFELIEKL